MKQISFIVAACAVFISNDGFCQNPPVVNPSFENPVEPSGSDTVIQQGAGSSSVLPGWTIDSAGGIFAIDNSQNNPSNALLNQNGSQYLVDVAAPTLGYSGAGTVSQILTTSFADGTYYDLYVWAGNANGAPAQLGDSVFIANSSGTVLASASLDSAPTNGSLAQFFVEFGSNGLIGQSGPIEIGFTSPAQASQSFMAVDDFEVLVVIPEPNSLAMILVSVVTCCIVLSGNRQKSLFKHTQHRVVGGRLGPDLFQTWQKPVLNPGLLDRAQYA